MRTTLNIEQDVLVAVKAIARQRGVSAGKVLSDLARQALAQQNLTRTRNGAPLFPIQSGTGIVTMEFINQLQNNLR